MIIDTRFKRCGDLGADLATFFTGVTFISDETEDKVVGGEPTSRLTKPTLSIFNEDMYSDGHCYAQGYTDLKIGKTCLLYTSTSPRNRTRSRMPSSA